MCVYICSTPEQYKSTPKYQTDHISQAGQASKPKQSSDDYDKYDNEPV